SGCAGKNFYTYDGFINAANAYLRWVYQRRKRLPLDPLTMRRESSPPSSLTSPTKLD
ncbi:hypothetical protein KI387_014526, partial [Taxus chinensis]